MMKNHLTFQWIVFAGLISMIIACTNSETSSLADSTTITATESIAMGTSACADSCAIITFGSFAISKGCSACSRKNYELNGFKFSKHNGQDVKGFKIDQLELREILEGIADDSTAAVYAMLAIADSVDVTDNRIHKVPELVFVVRSFDQAANTDQFVYYDFTRPCPDLCPEDGL